MVGEWWNGWMSAQASAPGVKGATPSYLLLRPLGHNAHLAGGLLELRHHVCLPPFHGRLQGKCNVCNVCNDRNGRPIEVVELMIGEGVSVQAVGARAGHIRYTYVT